MLVCFNDVTLPFNSKPCVAHASSLRSLVASALLSLPLETDEMGPERKKFAHQFPILWCLTRLSSCQHRPATHLGSRGELAWCSGGLVAAVAQVSENVWNRSQEEEIRLETSPPWSALLTLPSCLACSSSCLHSADRSPALFHLPLPLVEFRLGHDGSSTHTHCTHCNVRPNYRRWLLISFLIRCTDWSARDQRRPGSATIQSVSDTSQFDPWLLYGAQSVFSKHFHPQKGHVLCENAEIIQMWLGRAWICCGWAFAFAHGWSSVCECGERSITPWRFHYCCPFTSQTTFAAESPNSRLLAARADAAQGAAALASRTKVWYS